MRTRVWLGVLFLGFALAACGGETEEEEPSEPSRCGGLHWNEAESRDGYTGCEGVEGSWTCECGVVPAQAFQGATEVSGIGGATCGGAVREACSTSLDVVTPCAGLSGDPGTCWRVADGAGGVSSDTFECRCDRGTAPSEISGDSCLAALESACP